MTNEELQRIGQYAAKIQGADGSLSVLTFNESQDLEMLIQKRLDESDEMKVGGIRRLVKLACKPVAMPPEFKKRLLERLICGATKKGGCETKN